MTRAHHLALAAALVVAPALSEPALAVEARERVAAAIGKVLNDSAAAYTRGDLAGFLASYERSPQTTYVSGTQVIKGYDAIAQTYADRFRRKPGSSPGTLTLKLVDVRTLTPTHVLAIGQFKVVAPTGKGPPATGIFSLLFHKSAAGWRIAADHTS
ncbi:MAG TPA: SgcJ/EcaC family oxidoreductase [Sphingomonas sp.]|jgi:uncharacterized protein (TIGR02246 family)